MYWRICVLEYWKYYIQRTNKTGKLLNRLQVHFLNWTFELNE